MAAANDGPLYLLSHGLTSRAKGVRSVIRLTWWARFANRLKHQPEMKEEI